MPALRDPNDIAARLYTRARGGRLRYYADFRDYGDVEGKQQPLVAPGDRFATTNLETAKELAAGRLAELKAKRSALPAGPRSARALAVMAEQTLVWKATRKKARKQWLTSAEGHLETACDFFGDTKDIALIAAPDVSDYTTYLLQQSNGRSGTLSTGSVNHYLNTLSTVYKYAQTKGLVAAGTNPVQAAKGDRPTVEQVDTEWLEIAEMARVLNWADAFVPSRKDLAAPFQRELLYVYAYTGLRESEAQGLEIDDVNMSTRMIRVRPNQWRLLKSASSDRSVGIPTALWERLSEYLEGPSRPTGRLMFPVVGEKGERMITDLRKYLDKAPMPERLERPLSPLQLATEERKRQSKIERLLGKKRGPKPVETIEELLQPLPRCGVLPLRTKMLRHSWCAARLQTTDNGRPISPYTVMREMGHQDLDMIEKVYAHLGHFRVRGEEVSYHG